MGEMVSSIIFGTKGVITLAVCERLRGRSGRGANSSLTRRGCSAKTSRTRGNKTNTLGFRY